MRIDCGTGAIADFFHLQRDLRGLHLRNGLPELRFHGFQTDFTVGAVFIEHICFLRNGIDRCAAGDGTHIEGGFAVRFRRNRLLVKRRDQSGQSMDGVGPAEIAKRVAALSLRRDLIPVGADGAADGLPEVGTINREQRLHTMTVPLHNGAAALQIAQTLFTGIGHDQQAVLRLPLPIIQSADQQNSQLCRIIGDSGAVPAVCLFPEGHGLQIRKDRIRMRHEHGDIIILRDTDGPDHIPDFVNIHAFCAVGFQPRFYIRCPGILLMGRCRNGAEFFDQLPQQRLIFLNICFHITPSKRDRRLSAQDRSAGMPDNGLHNGLRSPDWAPQP